MVTCCRTYYGNERERNVLFNDAHNTFYLRLYYGNESRYTILLKTGQKFTLGCIEPKQKVSKFTYLQEKKRNVLFNDTLTTFYLRLYGVGHMVKDHSDSKRKPAAATWATLSDYQQGFFYMNKSHRQDRTYHGLCYISRGALAREIAQWVHDEGSIWWSIAPWANTLITEPHLGHSQIHIRERNVLFNNELNTFYLRLYGVRNMVKDHSDSEKGNPLPPHRLLLSINSKGYFICTIPQTG